MQCLLLDSKFSFIISVFQEKDHQIQDRMDLCVMNISHMEWNGQLVKYHVHENSMVQFKSILLYILLFWHNVKLQTDNNLF